MKSRPYYRRSSPKPHKPADFNADFNFHRIDLANAHLDPYPKRDASGALLDSRPIANSLFDARAAAAVSANLGDPNSVRIEPLLEWTTVSNEVCDDMGRCYTTVVDLSYYVDDDGTLDADGAHYDGSRDLLEMKRYNGWASQSQNSILYVLTSKSLATMAYADYFPSALGGQALRNMVSQAIMKASPGWCGSFGPGVTGALSLEVNEGNYDMNQMFLLPLAYSYYQELAPNARERLITQLLARGFIQRPNENVTFTSGGAPKDWSRAGHVSPLGFHVDIPETENHVLMIATARYLTNQLLYQRDHDPSHDNRRNGDTGDSRPSCMDQVLSLLRNYLRDDFAEYNAKNYQEETRHALLNLCTYAYDAEVRLGARMVLDYISAHIAVSSNDLRRMVPFRRRNEEPYMHQIPGEPGFMDVSLTDSIPGAGGADPMAAQFALLAGNTRCYQTQTGIRPWPWAITANFAAELTLGALSDYRLPPAIHDLFVNDLHRRFFQRLHRHFLLKEPGQQRNCENMEIYCGSPSYLITAGGKPARWVIPGDFGHGYKDQNRGVAVPNSFMPTGLSAGRIRSMQQLGDFAGMPARPMSLKAVAQVFGISVPFSFKQLSSNANPNEARDLIQLLRFSDKFEDDISAGDHGETENYGVAPDFVCGFAFHFPAWTGVPKYKNGMFFVDRKSHDAELAGFFLAIIKWQGFALMEAFDTWRHPEVSFEQFQKHVITENSGIQFRSGQKTIYTTYFGNRIEFMIWSALEQDNHIFGSKIVNIEYGRGNPADTLVGAGNDTDSFLSGTILNSPKEAVVEITNPFLGTKITLDWSDELRLVRTTETPAGKEIEDAGNNHEVWVDFDSTEPFEGDFFRPFNSIAAALDSVADGGVIKIVPGTTSETQIIHNNKRVTLVAPIGGVTIGAR